MPQVSLRRHKLSRASNMLVMLAERPCLTGTPEFRAAGCWPRRPTSPRQVVAGGFAVIIAELEAAGVLSPLSPVPARLATLCARPGPDRARASPRRQRLTCPNPG